MRLIRLLALLLCLAAPAAALAADGPAPVVVFETSKGLIFIQLDNQKAPVTTANFLKYVNSGFYDGTIFHRVVNNKGMGIVQGGGYDAAFHQKPTMPAIACESRNGLENKAGSIAMARTADPDSATSQFFVNVRDNDFLNFRSATPEGMGYAVFGRIIRGMNVIQDIANLRTTPRGMMDDVPVEQVVVRKAYLYKEP
ncbi:MAG: peptidylprolyl isomerase [Desulfovibrio aminophilus]|jgi:Peptidyl-prolyl cis-trans isomerase (rotamase) - cyclophilin family|uniref:peptidylprolyl isomerase n=1 Tax=Desulfovibrio aminophilus TaxID=81425 RepID=UPI002A444DD6|nr:peptidylprolyl isomerase [Desulfovibrionaceae bacterium]